MARIPLIPRCLQIGISFPLAMHKVPCVDVIIPGISTVPIEVTITDGSLAYIEKPRIYCFQEEVVINPASSYSSIVQKLGQKSFEA